MFITKSDDKSTSFFSNMQEKMKKNEKIFVCVRKLLYLCTLFPGNETFEWLENETFGKGNSYKSGEVDTVTMLLLPTLFNRRVDVLCTLYIVKSYIKLCI